MEALIRVMQQTRGGLELQRLGRLAITRISRSSRQMSCLHILVQNPLANVEHFAAVALRSWQMSLMSRHLPLNPGGKCQTQMSGNPGKGQLKSQ